MKIAPEGNLFILPFSVITILTVLYAWIASTTMVPSYILLLFLVFLLVFFRDPNRKCPSDENIIIAPADGKIIKIEDVDDPNIGSAVLVSIFLSVFNVHINRMPINGQFSNVKHHHGKFLAAFNHKASDENERTEILITSKIGDIKLKQVAGLVARRILCYAKPRETMELGDRLGFIRFGSRTDLIIPKHVTLKVELGQNVTGNRTIIGIYS
tara:strand:- start:225 stop:860 length:636 start_codon:yes stop_codon:yes gene_type:complete